MELTHYERPKEHHYLVVKVTRNKDEVELQELNEKLTDENSIVDVDHSEVFIFKGGKFEEKI